MNIILIILADVLVLLLLVMLLEMKRRRPLKSANGRSSDTEAEYIKKNKEMLHYLLNSTAEAIYSIDLKGNCTYANQACIRELGYTGIKQLLGKNMHYLIHHSYPDGSPMPVETCRIYQAFHEEKHIHVDDEVLWRADGSSFPAEYWSYPHRTNGQLSGAVISFVNITKRRQTEEALRESHKRFQDLAETLYDWVWEVDSKAHFTYVSPQVKNLLGYEPREILGKTPFDLMFPGEAKAISEKVTAVIKEGKPIIALKNINVHKDGHIVVMETNALPFHDADGKIKGYRGIDRDITRRWQAEDELMESRQKFQELVETLHDWVWETDTEYRYTYVSPQVTKILGYEPGEILGKKPYDFMPPDEAKRVSKAYREIIKEQKPLVMENINIHKDGRLLIMETNGNPFYDPDGNLKGYRGIKRDITDRRQAENALEESRKRFQGLVETLYDYIWEVDPQGYFTYISPQIKNILGYEPGELLGKTPFDIMPEDEAKRVSEIFLALVKDRKPIPALENTNIHKDGRRIILETNGRPFFDDNGNLKGYRGTDRDISERKRAEEALRSSESRYRALVESQDDLISRYSPDTVLTFVNDAYCRFYGKTQDELLGKSFLNMVAPEFHEAVRKETGSIIKEHKLIKGEYLNYRSDGSECWIQWVIKGITDGNNNVVEIQAVGRDITRLKQIEEGIRKSEEKLREAQHLAQMGNWELDLIRNKLTWSDGIYKIFEIDPAESVSYETFLSIIHPDDRTMVDYAYTESLENKTPYQITHRLLMNDGRVKWVSEICRTEYDKEGIPRKSSGVVQDITRQKQAEEAIEQTRQNFETFFNTVNEFLFVLDEQGNIIHTNATATDRLGYTSEELRGKSFLMVYPPERRDEAGRIVSEMLAGTAEFCPIPIVTKSGIRIPVETRVKKGIWNNIPVIFGVTKDISRIMVSEEKFSKIFHINPSACGLSNPEDHKYTEVNEAFYDLLGFSRNEVIGKTPWELGIFTPQTAQGIMQKADSEGKVTDAEADLAAKNGDIKHVLLSAETIYVQDKKYIYTIIYDITDRKQIEQALKESNEYLNKLIENANAPIIVWDTEFRITRFNRAFEQITGMSAEDVTGKHIEILFPEESKEQSLEHIRKTVSGEKWESVDIPIRNVDGATRTLLWNSANIYSGDGETLVSTFAQGQDITERMQATEKIRHMANHDYLTDLPTMRLARDRLSVAINAARRNKKKVAVMFFDMDGFKEVNDTLGHDAGDHVLKEVSKRLVSGLRATNTVARVGGDEFLLIATELDSPDNAALIAKNVLRLVSQPVSINGKKAAVFASIGIALYPDNGEDIEELIKRADEAMYSIKNTGKNGYGFARTKQ